MLEKRWMAAVPALVMVVAVLSPRPAVAHEYDKAALMAGIQAAASRQLSTQGTYPNGNAGSGVYTCAWPWLLVPPDDAYANTQGPSAMGLLAAYAVLHNPAYLHGVECAADQAMARYDALPSMRPYSDDEILLATLAYATGNRRDERKAKKYFDRVRAQFPTGADLADHYIDERRSLSGWDLSSQILAALDVGQEAYARGIADEILARRADWEGVLYGGQDYTELSYGVLVQALDDIRHDKPVEMYLRDILQKVLAAQQSDGSWGEDYQLTAYVIMGLDDANPRPVELQKAEARAVQYLLNTQDSDGGWSYPPEVGEVNGEALTALCLVATPGHDELGRRDFRGPRLFESHDSHDSHEPHERHHH